MTNYTEVALDALARRADWAPAAAFAAGLVTSIGPCAASRSVSLAAITIAQTRRGALLQTVSFVFGLVTAYVALAAAGSAIWRMMAFGTILHSAAAVVFCAVGAWMVIRPLHCRDHREGRTAQALSLPFLSGAASIMTLSPCCMPLLFAIGAFTASSGAGRCIAAAAAFALGHALPSVIFTECFGWLRAALRGPVVVEASRIVAGSLFVGLGVLYAAAA